MYRKREVVGIDGNLFNRLQHQANRENISIDVLIHRYLSFSLLYSYEVRKNYFDWKREAQFNDNTKNNNKPW